MAGRRKPHDPAAQIKAENARREQAQLQAHLTAQGAEVKLDGGGRVISARRSNVFTLLLARQTITLDQHTAAYDLANDWATWKGLDGKSDAPAGYVDGGSGAKELVTDRMIKAGKRINAILQQLDLHHVTLLVAFMVATVEEDRPMAWRGLVQRVTGETLRDKQPKLVVAALEALRRVYQEPKRMAA
jgi:hypothetical protein